MQIIEKMNKRYFYPQQPFIPYLKAGICLLAGISLLVIGVDKIFQIFPNTQSVIPLPLVIIVVPVGFCFSCVGLWTSLYEARFQHLVISSEKIEHHLVGFTISSTWQDVKRIRRHDKYHFGIDLILEDYQLNVWRPRWLFHPHENYAHIPLLTFDLNWEEDEIGMLIKQYAPHLFEALDVNDGRK